MPKNLCRTCIFLYLLVRHRNMEPAWEKVNGRKFALVEYRDKKGELRPCYSLTKTECLYIATKFNDEARAKLVLIPIVLSINSAHIAELKTKLV